MDARPQATAPRPHGMSAEAYLKQQQVAVYLQVPPPPSCPQPPP
jgi:hypothetical protein